jgi:uncharacterized protein (UPF0332 family)
LPDPEEAALTDARREINEARALLAAGFARQACVAAYYAAFYAVEEAQVSTGQRVPKTHGGVVAAFGRMAVAVDDREAGRLFGELRDQRIEIQYEHETATPEEAVGRIAAAERVIGVVEHYLAEVAASAGTEPGPGSGSPGPQSE